jgi:hypothetical protein
MGREGEAMNRKAELEMAARHCEQGARRVARQAALVEELRRDGHPIEQAEAVLATFEATLRQMEEHHALILAEIAAGEI